MTDVAPKTDAAALVVRIKKSLNAGGSIVHSGSLDALDRLHSLLLRAEEERDNVDADYRRDTEILLARLRNAEKERHAGLALVLAWINRKYGTIPDDPPSLAELIEATETEVETWKLDSLDWQRRLGEQELITQAVAEAPLVEARPYVYNAECSARADSQPWRQETAHGVLERLEAALAPEETKEAKRRA